MGWADASESGVNMEKQQNQFEPSIGPITLYATHSCNEINPVVAGCSFVGLPILGCVFGIVSFVGVSYVLETLYPIPVDVPILSHGQQSVLFTLPICAFIGLGTGISFAFAVIGFRAVAALVLAPFAIIALSINQYLWSMQISTYGRDAYSEMALYYPPLVLVFFSAIVLLLIAATPVCKNFFTHSKTK